MLFTLLSKRKTNADLLGLRSFHYIIIYTIPLIVLCTLCTEIQIVPGQINQFLGT